MRISSIHENASGLPIWGVKYSGTSAELDSYFKKNYPTFDPPEMGWCEYVTSHLERVWQYCQTFVSSDEDITVLVWDDIAPE